MHCKALLSGIVALAVLHVVSGLGLNVTLVYDSTTVGVDSQFIFNCTANETVEAVNFSVVFSNNPLNDTDGRWTCSEITNNVTHCIFDPLLDTDNGIGVMCKGEAGEKSGLSPAVPLNVLFPPTFDEGQGASLAMINESSNYTLSFTIQSGNPNTTTVELSTSLPPQDNVQNVTNNETVSMFEITDATLNNTGNYSATVSNSFGSTTLTYKVFVGGPLNASEFNISCSQTTNDEDLLLMSCNVADGNSAPAVTLDFRFPGLGLGQTFSFSFSEIPVNRSFSSLFNASLEHIMAGNYDLEIVATNGLSASQVNVYSQTFFVAGLEKVTIDANSDTTQTLGSGQNFSFSCAVFVPNQPAITSNITLLIDGSNNNAKLDKVSSNTTDTGINFSYVIDNYTDDQTVFACQYDNGSVVGLSANLTLTVYYNPLFEGGLKDTSLLAEIATGKDANLTCTVADYSGPEALNLTVTSSPNVPFNDSKTNESITVVITNATPNDPQPLTYTCHACYGKDDTLCSYLNYTTYVGGKPDNVSLQDLDVSGADSSGDEYSLTLKAEFTDYSEVPVTMLKYVISQTNTARNVAVKAPSTGVTQSINSTQTLKQTELGGGTTFDLDIYAVNEIGSLSVTMVKVTVSPAPTASSSPTSTPVKHKGAVIAIAILVPLAVIIFIIVAVAGGYYYYKKYRRPKTYQRINADNADIDDASGGIYGST